MEKLSMEPIFLAQLLTQHQSLAFVVQQNQVAWYYSWGFGVPYCLVVEPGGRRIIGPTRPDTSGAGPGPRTRGHGHHLW